jgi:hypothetical protein
VSAGTAPVFDSTGAGAPDRAEVGRRSLLYCFFVIEHGRRRILHFNLTRHPTAEWVVQQLREAFLKVQACADPELATHTRQLSQYLSMSICSRAVQPFLKFLSSVQISIAIES